MTDINELAQRMKAAALKAIADEGPTWFSKDQLSHPEGIALHEADVEFIALASHENVLALVEALEAKGKQIDILRQDKDTVIDTSLERINKILSRAEAAEKRIAELESDNAYIKNRHKELDLLIGKNILVMQAAIIEWQGAGDARKGLAWIYNTLFGPGELPDEAEKDAQAYFDRKYGPLDEELMTLHRWFWEQSEAERAAAAGKGETS